jgi:hypothetical protein
MGGALIGHWPRGASNLSPLVRVIADSINTNRLRENGRPLPYPMIAQLHAVEVGSAVPLTPLRESGLGFAKSRLLVDRLGRVSCGRPALSPKNAIASVPAISRPGGPAA